MEGGGGPEEVPRVLTAGLTCRVSYKTSELRMEEEAGEGWETAREMEAIPAYIFRKEVSANMYTLVHKTCTCVHVPMHSHIVHVFVNTKSLTGL